jgi:hypothetical protein
MPDANIKLANLVRVERHGSRTSLTIDGDEFPWFIAEGGVTVTPMTGEMPSVMIQLVADRVEVIDELDTSQVWDIAGVEGESKDKAHG